MIASYEFPATAEDRTHALERSGLLKYATAERMDVLVQTAGTLLGVYAAFVNIVDGKYQIHGASWPKHLEAAKMLRDDSACRLVLESKKIVKIENSDESELVGCGPFSDEGKMRSYLGIPVWDGTLVAGTFCVVDTIPRPWGFYEVSTMEGLARLAGLSIV